ncbi:YbaN family protein [Geosporobacter ferrireducens]|uniref:DUF454 domain-containing protein n=1 Tax=Geosporobacter ferrireducens TaxID=1424294 RepID=A0A1D8GG34_9FIRM|nr:YbaN family protein [Geosporobacter ferrireducens]AOT69852.1 hypothetical protein Gferi_09840 [Geosporobacter ferrireducens]
MKIIYLIIGMISLTLGVIGIFLPILPTTPFLLLTSFCFAKGSERFHRWFTGTSIYKNHLDDFVQNRAMSLRTKFSILIPASLMLLFPLILVDHTAMRLFIGFLYLCKYYYFIFKIKTI